MRYEIDLPEYPCYDVIVAGGGPAGCAAAAAAARQGAKTLLIEASGMLGGVASGGLVPSWCPFSDGEKVIYRGIGYRVFETLKERMPHVDPAALNWVPIHAETLKKIYDELMEEYKVKVLFFTRVCDTAVNGEGKIEALIAANREGLAAYRAKIYIDATGNADLSEFAGVEFLHVAGEKQPSSLCFTFSNVNEEEYRKAPTLHMHNKNSLIYDILKDERFPLIRDAHICQAVVAPGTIGFNAGHIWGAEADKVSEAMILGRKIAWQYKEALSAYLPEIYGQAVLSQTASDIGIREAKNILGDYTLTIRDYFERKDFDDNIGRNCYYIDVHFTKNESIKSRIGELKSEDITNREDFPEINRENAVSYGPGESHGIPYRILIPRGLRNLLTAGKAVSCDHLVQASIRAMPACFVTGEAAGTAAAMAALAGCETREIDIRALQDTLKKNGAYLG